jgi:hypothetical protein
MNFPQELAAVLASRFPGTDRPIIIFADSCNLTLPVVPIDSKGRSAQLPPDTPCAAGENGSASGEDENDRDATVPEVLNPLPASPPQIAPVLRRHFHETGAMTTKQVFDCLINSGEYVTLKDLYKEDTDKKVRTALYQMKADGHLTKANGKQDTPWIPTEKLNDLYKESGVQEPDAIPAWSMTGNGTE